jgi:hypothetical protein
LDRSTRSSASTITASTRRSASSGRSAEAADGGRSVRVRDHGIVRLRPHDGVAWDKGLAIDDLVTARDHGIGPEYIRDLGSLGYRGVALPDLVRLRDHGVNPAWLRVVKDRNSGTPSIDQLVTLRDHGVETLQDLRRKRGV